jgi:xanthine dehydrogenase YagT iron-sulfur-binding subunit
MHDPHPPAPASTRGVDRRRFLGATATSTAAPLLLGGLGSGVADAQTSARTASTDPQVVKIRVNGRDHALALDPRVTLLDALRQHLSLTGAKKGCDHGQCGACTVLVDGKRILSCLTLAAAVRGEVTTIEGLGAPSGDLHPMQQAFIEQDAFQCGYCTPGQIMSAIACVKEGNAKDPDAIREYMSGNLCRCAAYPHIVAAIEQAASKMGA